VQEKEKKQESTCENNTKVDPGNISYEAL